jgi:hypothetical protein
MVAGFDSAVLYGLITVWYALTLLLGSLAANYIMWGELEKISPNIPREEIERIYETIVKFKRIRNLFFISIAITMVMWVFFLAALFVMSIA